MGDGEVNKLFLGESEGGSETGPPWGARDANLPVTKHCDLPAPHLPQKKKKLTVGVSFLFSLTLVFPLFLSF